MKRLIVRYLCQVIGKMAGALVEFIQTIGLPVKKVILWLANVLTESNLDTLSSEKGAAPGFVAALLFVFLVIGVLIYSFQVRRKSQAILWLYNLIKSYETPQEFTQNITDIDIEVRKRWGQNAYDELARGWLEYKETLVLYGEGDSRHLRNSVRPATFFNAEDLNFTPGFWKILPGLFVTIGLFLTFLGLIAALDSLKVTGMDAAQLKDSLQTLLETASAKFIMSLTGLACSIIFTIRLRLGVSQIENRLHELANHTEFLLKFISLEDIATDQLAAIKEQKEHFRTIGLELVAELGRPLKEDLPITIAQSISDAMSPLISKVTEVGTEGVGGMVSDLSEKFSKDVSGALESASISIQAAGDKIDQSSANIGAELSSSVLALKQMIDEVQESTKGRMLDTGDAIASSFGQTANQITEQANSLSETLIAPLNDLQAKIAILSSDISESGGQFKIMSESVKLGADAAQKAASSFEKSAQDFSKVTSPINRSIELIAGSISDLEDSTANVNDTLTQGIKQLMASSENALNSAVEIIRGEQSALENALQGMQDVIEEFRGQGDRLDELDEKLGVAFETYAEHVESQLEEMKLHARDLTERLTPALDKMREVVEHAEQFIPESGVQRR
jgi:ABC-type transporter Mla subunit MlaD